MSTAQPRLSLFGQGADAVSPEISGVHIQELAAKIAENERLHMKV